MQFSHLVTRHWLSMPQKQQVRWRKQKASEQAEVIGKRTEEEQKDGKRVVRRSGQGFKQNTTNQLSGCGRDLKRRDCRGKDLQAGKGAWQGLLMWKGDTC